MQISTGIIPEGCLALRVFVRFIFRLWPKSGSVFVFVLVSAKKIKDCFLGGFYFSTENRKSVVVGLYARYMHPQDRKRCHLLYGVEVQLYASTHSSYLEKLMVLNNKILHIVPFKPLKNSCSKSV